ncbi:MAG TPA: 50S ribosomal protein L22 [Bacteroidales bacterium]|nr:50S ribosomal protein L22 [Bacteroidales bacterium]HQL69325.1 50S ribosomal protein L22 [Bacteroidales bacterium]
MGARKRNRANQRKEEKRSISYAELNNCPTSPMKMRIVADMVRGVEVNKALDMLKYSPKHASKKLEKLIMSAVSNWQAKNEGVRMEEAGLFVKEISVDEGRSLKRVQPAPQGRAYRVRKRSNHVYVVIGSHNAAEVNEQESLVENEN